MASRRPQQRVSNDGRPEDLDKMDQKQCIAVSISLQANVLKVCPHHRHFFYDEADPAPAFALAVDLIRIDAPRVAAFHRDVHELTDLMSETLGATPLNCPECQSAFQQEAAGILSLMRRAGQASDVNLSSGPFSEAGQHL